MLDVTSKENFSLEEFLLNLEEKENDLSRQEITTGRSYNDYEKLLKYSFKVEQESSLKDRYMSILYKHAQEFAYDFEVYDSLLIDLSDNQRKEFVFDILRDRNFVKATGFIKHFNGTLKNRDDVGKLIAEKLDKLKSESEKARTDINNSYAKDKVLINKLSRLNKAIERLNYLYEKFFGIRYLLLSALFLAICLLISLGEYGFDKLINNPFKWSSDLKSVIKAHLAQIILLLLAFACVPIVIKKVIPIIRPVFTNIFIRVFGDREISSLDNGPETKQ